MNLSVPDFASACEPCTHHATLSFYSVFGRSFEPTSSCPDLSRAHRARCLALVRHIFNECCHCHCDCVVDRQTRVQDVRNVSCRPDARVSVRASQSGIAHDACAFVTNVPSAAALLHRRSLQICGPLKLVFVFVLETLCSSCCTPRTCNQQLRIALTIHEEEPPSVSRRGHPQIDGR